VAFEDFVSNQLTASDSAPLEILDIIPPTITLSVSPTILWPPNHKFQDITATISVTDECDPNPDVTLISVTSNEPETGFLGNGDKGPDIQGAAFGTDDRLFSLRAERARRPNTGYTITYRVTDASSNFTDATPLSCTNEQQYHSVDHAGWIQQIMKTRNLKIQILQTGGSVFQPSLFFVGN
jgi:hypothetical protein